MTNDNFITRDGRGKEIDCTQQGRAALAGKRPSKQLCGGEGKKHSQWLMGSRHPTRVCVGACVFLCVGGKEGGREGTKRNEKNSPRTQHPLTAPNLSDIISYTSRAKTQKKRMFCSRRRGRRQPTGYIAVNN